MNEFPRLPEHYVRRTIADIGPEEPYYLKTEDNLFVDRTTLQPYLSKDTPVTAYEKSPSSLNGRFGIMRIIGQTAGKLIDGYVIDMRFVDDNDIVQDDITPNHDDSYDIVKQKEEESTDLISPIGLIVNDSESANETLLGSEPILPYLLLLCEKTDEIHERIASRPTPKRSRRPLPPSNPSSQNAASLQLRND
jgi:hypothetical protein